MAFNSRFLRHYTNRRHPYIAWNAWYCDINENAVLETANLIKSLGLAVGV